MDPDPNRRSAPTPTKPFVVGTTQAGSAYVETRAISCAVYD